MFTPYFARLPRLSRLQTILGVLAVLLTGSSARASDADLAEFIKRVVDHKEARHHIGEPGFVPASRTMVHIGG